MLFMWSAFFMCRQLNIDPLSFCTLLVCMMCNRNIISHYIIVLSGLKCVNGNRHETIFDGVGRTIPILTNKEWLQRRSIHVY